MSTQASFRARCPHCSNAFSVRAELEGKTIACPNPACGKPVSLSAEAETYSLQAAPTKVADPAAQPLEIADQLQKLHRLHQSGALSVEEFATAKKALLNGPAKAKKPYKLPGAKPAETIPADALQHLVRDQLQKWLQPLTEYWAGLQRAANPKEFGDYVASKEGNAADLFKFVAASIALTSAVEYVLPNRSLIEFTASGVVNNLLMMLICALGGLLIATITYKPLRWFGGQGSFHATLIAAVYVTALYYPILSLLEGLFKFVTYKPITYVNFLLLIPYCQVIAQIHKLSVGRTMFTVLGAIAPAAVVLLSLMIPADKHPRKNAPAKSPVAVQKQAESRVSSKEPSPAEEEPNDNAILSAAVQRQTVRRERSGGLILQTPGGLQPGDQFRFVFLTDGKTNATSPNISTYDSFVTTQAGGATYNGLTITWQAIGSTATVNAVDHIGSSTAGVYLASGAAVAASTTSGTNGFWSGSLLMHAIDQDLTGNTFSKVVWTGTAKSNPFGHTSVFPLGDSADQKAKPADSGAIDQNWIANTTLGAPYTDQNAMYGISQVLTVPAGK